MAEKYFLDNLYKYDKPYKLIKDLIEYNQYLFNVYDNEYIYTFCTKQSKSYGIKKYVKKYHITYMIYYEFYIEFFFENKEWDPIRTKYKMNFFTFITVKVIKRWRKFVKKRKVFRKLLKPVAEHLGNPRFMDFKI